MTRISPADYWGAVAGGIIFGLVLIRVFLWDKL